MNKKEAEEYTQSLEKIVAGSWQQIEWADKMGIPQALGLPLRVWVQERIGGYVKQTIEERQLVVKTLSVSGMSQRKIADILGITNATVSRDLNGTNVPEPEPEPAKNKGNSKSSGTNVTVRGNAAPKACPWPSETEQARKWVFPTFMGTIEEMSKTLKKEDVDKVELRNKIVETVESLKKLIKQMEGYL